jgi:predicted nucleic acid-binding protein
LILLIDTSTLLRTLQPLHPQCEIAREAVKATAARGEELQLVPQNLMELWVVATRPAEHNGLGFTIAEAASELRRLKRIFRLLPETPEIYPVWESLVLQYQVAGKPAHDARLVAAMRVHGIASILTFDKSGFSRYAGIEVLHPAEVLGG